MYNIILASASPRRKELLDQVGLKFQVIPPETEETIENIVDPAELVCTLSRNKAMDIAKCSSPDSLVIGADTIVVLKERILGKPKNTEEAFTMLNSLQGEWHEVFTGVTVVDAGSNRAISDYEKTKVKMRPLSEDLIKAYIKTGEPMDKAGAYGIQKKGALLIEKIEGCYFNVVGLPLVKVCVMLEKFGFNMLK